MGSNQGKSVVGQNFLAGYFHTQNIFTILCSDL